MLTPASRWVAQLTITRLVAPDASPMETATWSDSPNVQAYTTQQLPEQVHSFECELSTTYQASDVYTLCIKDSTRLQLCHGQSTCRHIPCNLVLRQMMGCVMMDASCTI